VEHEDVDVIVVGAGLSGLAAARRLLAEGFGRLVVLEAREEPGGRCIWRNVGDHLVHPGPAWTGAKQDHIKALAAQYGIATYRIDVDGAKYARTKDGEVQYSDEREPRLTGMQGDELERARGELSHICERVSASRPWDAPDAESLDTTTAASWIHSRSTDPVVLGVLERLVQRSGASPSQMSMLSVAARIGSCGGIDGLETDVDELFVDGVAAIPRAIAKDLGARLRLRWPVAQISWSDGIVRVAGPRGTVSAKRAIVAMSAADARGIQVSPGLSPMRELLHRGWFTSAGIKMMFVYASPFWHRTSAKRPPIKAVINEAGDPYTVLDQSPADGRFGVLAASLGMQAGSASSANGHDDRAVRQRRVLDTLVRIYGAEAKSPLGISETHWDEEPFISGCHGFPRPGVLRECGRALRDPIGPLHWAGTETAEVWINHMDGAVQSGERAAAEVSAFLATGIDSR
jgi:monoamine oxidase